MNRTLLTTAAVFGCALLWSQQGFAKKTANSTIAVSADVNASCTMESPAMTFGVYTPATGTSATTTVSLTCTGVSTGMLSIDDGANATANVPAMVSGTVVTKLPYKIHLGASTDPIFNSLSTPATVAVIDGAGTQDLTGVIAPGLVNVLAATDYTDTINVSFEY